MSGPIHEPQPGVILAHRQPRPIAGRRAFLRNGFFAGLGLTALSGATGLWNFAWPRNVGVFGGSVAVRADRVPQPGDDPVRVVEGKFWLVHLNPGEGAHGKFGEPGDGGLLALYQKCPHLGCTVPWQPTFEYEGVRSWFRCPCHGSTYTRAGIRVKGPAPRPLDTMAVEVRADGSLVVDTGAITLGGLDNARRAVPYWPAPSVAS